MRPLSEVSCSSCTFTSCIPSWHVPRRSVHSFKGRTIHQHRPSERHSKNEYLKCRALGEDPYDALFRSSVFQSDLVKREFTSVMGDLMSLRTMAKQFPDFDLAGKRLYLDKMEESCGRYEIFMKRLELSSDPAAREFLRSTNAQMLEAGFTLQMMFTGLKQSLATYRHFVTEEEKAMVDPETHSRFKEGLRAAWDSSALTFMDITNIDANIVMQANRDPRFWKAIQEIKQDPQMMSKWKDDPTIGPMVLEMWKQFMKKENQ